MQFKREEFFESFSISGANPWHCKGSISCGTPHPYNIQFLDFRKDPINILNTQISLVHSAWRLKKVDFQRILNIFCEICWYARLCPVVVVLKVKWYSNEIFLGKFNEPAIEFCLKTVQTYKLFPQTWKSGTLHSPQYQLVLIATQRNVCDKYSFCEKRLNRKDLWTPDNN